MRYFGVPTCPYCKKRVNLIRTWSLKRQGEYQCPRCGGISNIFLSPLIYVLALLAVFAGGSMYFFHKFVLDDISLDTAVYVFIPFAAFFLFSLFMVYLEKPVIRKVSKEEYQKKRRIRSAVDGSAGAVPSQESRHGYQDEDDYIPRGSYRPGPDGPAPETARQGVVNQAAFSRAKLQAAAENTQQSQRSVISGAPARQQQGTGRPVPERRPQPQAQAKVQQPRPRTISGPGQAPRLQARPGVQQQRPASGRAPQPRQQSFSQQGAAMQQNVRAVNQAQGYRPPQPGRTVPPRHDGGR